MSLISAQVENHWPNMWQGLVIESINNTKTIPAKALLPLIKVYIKGNALAGAVKK